MNRRNDLDAYASLFWQGVKFGITGLINTGVHVAVVVFLVEVAGADPVLSSIPAFLTAVTVSFLLSRLWVFGAVGRKLPQLLRFLVVTASGFGLNILSMHLGTKVLELSYLLVLALTIPLIALWGFVLNRFWTFREAMDSPLL